MIEEINVISLSKMKNALYVQFMTDVDFHVKRVTPEALKIKNCYAAFLEGYERVDKTFITQRKDNRTMTVASYDTKRNRGYSCLLAYINAGTLSLITENQEVAQILRNKFDAYGYLPCLSNNEKSSKMSDLCKELKAAPFADMIKKLGITAEVDAMEEANNAFVDLSRERTESGKSLITEEMKAARKNMDEKYHNMINVVNSQICINEFMDGNEEERPGELSDQDDSLADFAQSINALIKEYKTKMAQLGPDSKGDGNDERPGEL